MLKRWCLFILLFGFVHGIELKLSTGLIRGKSVKVGHKNLHMFKKIPFAKPPVGNLRFQKPRRVSKWTGTLDASEYGPSCMINITRSDYPVESSEDCLYVNVFTSDICLHTKNCPVFIMLHGGAFVFGNAVQYNDTQILEKYVANEIIFILPAYRVGFFGFFDFGEDYDDAPYNVGLYDIIAALNWTQREISNFGGDKRQVTLFGYSSGATAIQYLMSSPKLQDHKLFNQVMLSSGLPTMAPNLNRNITERFLKVMECSHHPDSNDTLEIEQKLECLRNKSAVEMNLKAGLVKKWWGHLGPQSSKDLLPARSYVTLAERRKPVPLLIITSKDEMGLLYEPDPSIEHLCQENLLIFDYIQNATIKACVKRYNDTYLQTRDTYHSIAVRECQINSRAHTYNNLQTVKVESKAQFAKNLVKIEDSNVKTGAKDAKNFKRIKSEAVSKNVVKQADNDKVKVEGIVEESKSAKNFNKLQSSSNNVKSEAIVKIIVKQAKNGQKAKVEGIVEDSKLAKNFNKLQSSYNNNIKAEGVYKNIVKKAYNVDEVVEIRSEAPTGNLTKYAHTIDEFSNITTQESNDIKSVKAGRPNNVAANNVGVQFDKIEDGAIDAKEGEKVKVESPVNILAHQAEEGESVEVQGVISNETAQVYSQHPCYLGIFAQVNRSTHADDILYMVGQHLMRIGEFTENDKLMDQFYPKLIRNFVHGRAPTEDWLPTNAHGENYYLLDFDVQSDNLKERVWPHLVANETYDSKTVDFYLKYLRIVENNASQFNPEHRNPLIFGQNLMALSMGNETERDALKDREHLDQINEYQRLYGYTSLWTIFLLTTLLLVFGIVFQAKKRRPNDAYWQNYEEPPIAMPSEKTRLLA